MDVFDERQVPEHFWVTPEPKPPEARIDRVAVKAAIKAGIDVPGAKLTQAVRLEVL